jgi:hypothetical protein
VEADAEPVGSGLRHLAHVPSRGQRLEDSVSATFGNAQAAAELGNTEFGLVSQAVQ